MFCPHYLKNPNGDIIRNSPDDQSYRVPALIFDNVFYRRSIQISFPSLCACSITIIGYLRQAMQLVDAVILIPIPFLLVFCVQDKTQGATHRKVNDSLKRNMSILTVTNRTLLEVVNGSTSLCSVTDTTRKSPFSGSEKNSRVCRDINHFRL